MLGGSSTSAAVSDSLACVNSRLFRGRHGVRNPSLMPSRDNPRQAEAIEREQAIKEQQEREEGEEEEEETQQEWMSKTQGLMPPPRPPTQSRGASDRIRSHLPPPPVDPAFLQQRKKQQKATSAEDRARYEKEHARVMQEQEQERARYEQEQSRKKALAAAAAAATSTRGGPDASLPASPNEEEVEAGADAEIEEEMMAAAEAERMQAEEEEAKRRAGMLGTGSTCDLAIRPTHASSSATPGSLLPSGPTLISSFSSPHLSLLHARSAALPSGFPFNPASHQLSRIQREVAKLEREGTTHIILLLSEGDFREMGVDKDALHRAITQAGMKQLHVNVANGPLQIAMLIDLVQVAMNVVCHSPHSHAKHGGNVNGASGMSGAAMPSSAVREPKLLLISKSGFHRAGLLAACILCALGLPVEQSVRLVRETRGARALGGGAGEQLVAKFDAAFKQHLIQRVLTSGELFHSTIRPTATHAHPTIHVLPAEGTHGNRTTASASTSSGAVSVTSNDGGPTQTQTPSSGHAFETPGTNRAQITIWPPQLETSKGTKP